MIRVGDDAFYAVTTSTDWAPFFPIFRSVDLVTWTLVGHVFAERPAWCVGNFWAPDFAEKNGRFYVYYTARQADGPLCVAVATADHPEGPYTDHGPLVGQQCGSIDAMAADDETGKRWLLWKEDGNSVGRPTLIWAQRLSADGIRLEHEPLELLRNDAPWEGPVVEAAHMVHRNGWLYLFYSGNACCGEDCAYAVGVARARTISGPWEKCPANPILAGNDAFRCPGHGAPVSDVRGRWYYLYHAYEQQHDALSVGRQLCLDAIEWGADGWPTINGGRGPSRVAACPFGAPGALAPERRWTADFGAPPDRLWQWPQSKAPHVTIEDGALRIAGIGSRRGHDPLAAVYARRTTCGDYAATARVDGASLETGTLASIVACGSHRQAAGIGLRDGSVVLWRQRGGKFNEVAQARVGPGRAVWLRCAAVAGNAYRFAFSVDGRTWINLGGRIDAAWLTPWDAGVRIALSAGGTGARSARFTGFAIAPRPATVVPLERSRRRSRLFGLLRRHETFASA